MLIFWVIGAGDGDRTRDVQLGNSFISIDNKGYTGLAPPKSRYNLVKKWRKRNPRATKHGIFRVSQAQSKHSHQMLHHDAFGGLS
jgi:hypothetical protein